MCVFPALCAQEIFTALIKDIISHFMYVIFLLHHICNNTTVSMNFLGKFTVDTTAVDVATVFLQFQYVYRYGLN